MDFLGKKPECKADWNNERDSIAVAFGFLGKLIEAKVRDGVLLGINDAIGVK